MMDSLSRQLPIQKSRYCCWFWISRGTKTLNNATSTAFCWIGRFLAPFTEQECIHPWAYEIIFYYYAPTPRTLQLKIYQGWLGFTLIYKTWSSLITEVYSLPTDLHDNTIAFLFLNETWYELGYEELSLCISLTVTHLLVMNGPPENGGRMRITHLRSIWNSPTKALITTVRWPTSPGEIPSLARLLSLSPIEVDHIALYKYLQVLALSNPHE